MLVAFISLLFGLIIGYMAQRSRMCFIGGIRDYILVRDTYLLRGLFAFVITAAVLFYLASIAGGDTYGYPWYERETRRSVELARDFYVFAACAIPDEVLIAASQVNQIKGVNLPGGFMISYVGLGTIAASLGIGYLSTVANGCPLRQHVLAASGNRGARMYLVGFYVGAIIFTYFISPLLRNISP